MFFRYVTWQVANVPADDADFGTYVGGSYHTNFAEMMDTFLDLDNGAHINIMHGAQAIADFDIMMAAQVY